MDVRSFKRMYFGKGNTQLLDFIVRNFTSPIGLFVSLVGALVLSLLCLNSKGDHTRTVITAQLKLSVWTVNSIVLPILYCYKCYTQDFKDISYRQIYDCIQLVLKVCLNKLLALDFHQYYWLYYFISHFLQIVLNTKICNFLMLI